MGTCVLDIVPQLAKELLEDFHLSVCCCTFSIGNESETYSCVVHTHDTCMKVVSEFTKKIFLSSRKKCLKSWW